MIEKAKQNVGVDHILFGSDGLDYIGFILEAVLGTPHLSEEEKGRILGLNALDLLRLVGS